MNDIYLEVTYRQGQPIAAYLYLPRRAGEKSYRSSKAGAGLVIDFNRRGRAIGIEITAPGKVTALGINRVLKDLGFPPVEPSALAPLRAA